MNESMILVFKSISGKYICHSMKAASFTGILGHVMVSPVVKST